MNGPSEANFGQLGRLLLKISETEKQHITYQQFEVTFLPIGEKHFQHFVQLSFLSLSFCVRKKDLKNFLFGGAKGKQNSTPKTIFFLKGSNKHF